MAPRKNNPRKDRRRKTPRKIVALTDAEIKKVCAAVKDTDVPALAANIRSSVREELHLDHGDRVVLLEHIDSDLTRLVSLLINIFASLYPSCFESTKLDRYITLQAAWLSVVGGAISSMCGKLGPATKIPEVYVCEKKLGDLWREMTSTLLHPITRSQNDDIIAVGHAIAANFFKIVCEKVKNVNSHTEFTLQEVEQFHEETEYGLLAVAGGCVQRIKKNLLKKRQHSRQKPLIDVMFACVRTKKQKEATQMPTGLALRDRGGLLIPQRVFLPWLRHLDRAIRLHASERGLESYGRNMIKMTVQQVSCLSAIKDLFLEGAKYACRMKGVQPELTTLEKMNVLWQQKIVHARVNEFIVAHQLREAEQQGLPLTQGGFTLRDELYSIASK